MLEQGQVPPTLEILIVEWHLDTPLLLASGLCHPIMPLLYRLLRDTTTPPTLALGLSG